VTLYWYRSPFTDLTSSKKRPAVVVSSHLYNKNKKNLIIMPVTSQIHEAYYGDTALKDWQQSSLLKPSVIKPIMTTLEKTLVIRKFGELSETDQTALLNSIKNIIGKQ
jgi:mRNA interferase MazF